MTAPVLSLNAVDKTFGSGAKAVHAVRALDMEVEPGEIVALLGSSGCGKTSTLRMIAGFEEVTAGSVKIAGREVNQLAPAKRNVAMAFEGYSLYPPLTVAQNIGFALKSQRLARAEIDRRVAEIAELLEIESILGRYPSSISGGQQQRASLGRALIRDAALHLLDEPMGQLEPQLRTLLRGRIKHFLKERGFTAILVTHDQTEANALADRIAVMEEGVLQQFAPPAVLKERPANLFTGTFIGEPPMNVFPIKVGTEGEAIVLSLSDDVTFRYPQESFAAPVCASLTSERAFVLGVRPQAVKRGSEGAPGRVAANQWLGDQTHIVTDFAGGTLISVEHDRAALTKGEEIRVTFEAQDLHFFDAGDGSAVSHGGEPA